ncbi:helix-hairpin-helix domain-containing protein [Tamlana sp. 2_MG-2023]|uniref:ComEA family DNA-binding protein n=1 Tax=unclassified Tamlana TaxID=2614803 RepID=UPI0026E2B9B8|nr:MULTISPECIES: helix-hairpin-helix domain-containing protein [unclassified Tamlana]MDO6760174.1 helix-hairpin-helix domain-containing protein [Tamlana sp. 2_MG-2023]MDO6790128.1 helix-hairpin-helix domain-containing protein [Tamlana sp. 1_MG-2023]
MKSHVTFSKNQRNGIFLLLLLIVVFQCVYFFVDAPYEDVQINSKAFAAFEKEIDSLRLAKLQKRQNTIKPFNPNYIDDFKGSVLGMSNEEIDRLLAFRKEKQWINSSEQFQEVTKVSDSLFMVISPYFKFPDWVSKNKNNKLLAYSNQKKQKTFAEKQDLNTASAAQLQKVNGIGKVLSERIIKFRNTFVGGFIADIQLEDVYGLSPEVIERITNEFTVKTSKAYQKINLNQTTVEELVTIPHIDYDLAYHIIEQRQLRSGYKSLNELLKVKDFPVNKIKIIQLYLQLEKNRDE